MFTYTPNSEKKKLFVIEGLNKTFSPDEIKQELQETPKKTGDIEKVEKLKTEKNNNYLILQFSTNNNVNEAIKIKTIVHQKIRWETYNKREVFQYFNCQRVGHTSKNCNLAYRYVKCIENHPRRYCKINTTTQEENPRRVNCQGNHLANYRGCHYIKQAQEEQNNTTKKTLKKRLSFNTTTNTNNASKINTKNISTYPQNNTITNQTNQINAPSINNNELTDLQNLINSF